MYKIISPSLLIKNQYSNLEKKMPKKLTLEVRISSSLPKNLPLNKILNDKHAIKMIFLMTRNKKMKPLMFQRNVYKVTG